MSDNILTVDNLGVEFDTDDGIVQAVRGVSFAIAPGETLGIVGESGSGKSVTNMAMLDLIPRPPGRIVSGAAHFLGQDLLTRTQDELCKIRGNRIAMIFQDPMTALNPFLTISEQLTEVTRIHLGHTYDQARKHAVDMLQRVGLSSAENRIDEYPHQFSGGMRQRVMIAMALLCKPNVLIADEPTTALDVSIQAQILDLMRELQREEGTAIILITHDMGVIANICQRVLVMYGGKVVEEAEVDLLFTRPKHPYTIGLLNSIPRIDEEAGVSLQPIDGQPPTMTDLGAGCSFQPRCGYCIERCETEEPPLTNDGRGHQHACFVDINDGNSSSATMK